jgi:aminoglycoside phosphotransferase (APT) family kinase protein
VNEEKAGWVRSTPPRALSPEELATLAARAFPGWTVSSAELITGGLSNTNYKVRFVDRSDAFVLRFYTRDPGACARDRALFAHISSTVPVPEIVHVEETLAWMRWIDGCTLRELRERGSPGAVAGAARSIGRVLAAMGRYTFAGSGPLRADLSVDTTFAAGPGSIQKLFHHCLEQELLGKWLDAPARMAVRRLVDAEAARLRPLETASHLVHMDFNGPNILVAQQNEGWEVAAVLDWEFAFSGSPLFDLGNLLRYEREDRPRLEPHVSDAYTASGGVLTQDWRFTARLADLLSLLEIMTRPSLPGVVGAEVAQLVTETLRRAPPR